MPRPVRQLSLVLASLAATTVVAGLVAFTVESGGFSPSATALVSIGLLLCTFTAVTGFLLVHAPWGRWGLCGVTAAAVVLATTNTSAVVFVVVALGAATIVGLAGPWIRFWVRQQPVPDGPNAVALSLVTVAPVAPFIVGLGAYDTSHWLHWLAASTAVVSSFLFARALPGSLWLLRLVVPVTGVAAAVVSPIPAGLLTWIGALGVGVLAWLPGAASVTTNPAPHLPAPRPPTKVPSDAGE